MDSMSDTVMTSAAAVTCEKDGSVNRNNNNNNNNSKKKIHDETTNMTNIRSMALPWGIMVIASIIAAGVVILYQDQQQDNDYSDYISLSSSSSSQSLSSHLERFLNTEHDHDHVHVHKPVYEENHTSLFPLSTNDRIGFSLAICGLMLAAGGGIGGGGILVPIYILVMGFSPKHGEYSIISIVQYIF